MSRKTRPKRRRATCSIVERLTPRSAKLETLAAIWLRAERVSGLLIAAGERRPADDWRLLARLCDETGTRLTMIVEQPASDHHVAALGGDARQLTLAERIAETPVMPKDPWGLFDTSESPDDHPGYPPVPDVDFALCPSACTDVLLQDDAAWALSTFDQARRATMLWLELRRGIEKRHGPSPRHAHTFLDTLLAPCVTVDGAITFLRDAQAGFLLDGILLEIDADAFAVHHARHVGAPATSATARMLRSYPEPHLAAAGALACATRANPAQIAGLTLAGVTPVDASLASSHRIAPPFQPLLDAQRLARDADGHGPLFLAPDGTQPAAPASHPPVAWADRSRDRLAVRERLWMKSIHDPCVGDLSPARDPRTDRALTALIAGACST